MRVLVTGGAGYIGSVVTEDLLASGHEVVVYDHLGTGHRDAVPAAARFVAGDILDTAALTETLSAARIDAVMHMAADALVGESMAQPAKYYRTNLTGGLSVLEAMRAAGVSRVVLSSTAAVYGEPLKQPIDEDDPLHPTNPYGDSKLAFERALDWHDAAYGLRSIRLRYFNAAGATERRGERHDPETHLIPRVLAAALGAAPAITINGDDYPTPDGTCVRDYVHVSDLSRAHLLAVAALARGHATAAYNLGCGGAGTSIRELIDVAGRVTARDIPVRVGPRRDGDPAWLVAGTERVRAALGWVPRHGLDAIVESAWRWLRR
jgi:UDP-glucose 4-epimerase